MFNPFKTIFGGGSEPEATLPPVNEYKLAVDFARTVIADFRRYPERLERLESRAMQEALMRAEQSTGSGSSELSARAIETYGTSAKQEARMMEEMARSITYGVRLLAPAGVDIEQACVKLASDMFEMKDALLALGLCAEQFGAKTASTSSDEDRAKLIPELRSVFDKGQSLLKSFHAFKAQTAMITDLGNMPLEQTH